MKTIPSFISSRFNGLPSRDAKNKMLQSLQLWRSSEFSEELVKYLEKELNRLIEQEEKETPFISLFQSKYSGANAKGQRKSIRKVIKFLKEDKSA